MHFYIHQYSEIESFVKCCVYRYLVYGFILFDACIKKVDSKEIWIRSPISTEFIRKKEKEKHLLFHSKKVFHIIVTIAALKFLVLLPVFLTKIYT